MIEILKRRKQAYYKQNMGYLRYVFNDHFLLFLVIALAALGVQYSQFLQHNTLSFPIRAIILVILSILLLSFGKLASFIEEADSVFLLPKEEEFVKHLKKSRVHSLSLPGIIYLVAVLVSSPLIKLNVVFAFTWFILLILFKFFLLNQKLNTFVKGYQIDWYNLIAYEKSRQLTILKVFSLFTTVKGITTTAKRRKHLDFLLKKDSKSFYGYLYLRTYLRSRDYLALTIRLGLISLILLAFIPDFYASVILAVIFDYLLLFQLLSLKDTYEYQPLIKTYPNDEQDKLYSLRRLIMIIVSILVVLQMLLILRLNAFALLFMVLSVFFYYLYIIYRLNK